MNLFKKSKILVIGDAMLDKYSFGTIDRISPEAPVPVLKVKEEILKPGGAANVAANVRSLGIETNLVSNIGKDLNGKALTKLIKSLKINLASKTLENFKTTTKTRVISQNQQLIRIDDDSVDNSKNKNIFTKNVEKLIKNSDAIIISDYNKGSIKNISSLITTANKNNKPIFVDPKGNDFSRYKDAFAITPNLKEFENIVGYCKNHKDIISKAKLLSKKLNINYMLITLGSDGMLLTGKNIQSKHIKATSSKEVFDVTGAGDTVIAVLCSTYISSEKKDMYFASIVANIAAGEVVKKLGAQSIGAEELTNKLYEESSEEGLEDEFFKIFEELYEFNKVIKNKNDLDYVIRLIKKLNLTIGFTNGCFDILHRGHTEYLDEARNSVDFLFVGINDDSSVKNLKGNKRPINNIKDRIEMLRRATLDEAFIIKFSESTPINLIKTIKPDILMKGGDYKENEIIGSDFVKKNKGKVKIIPLVRGVSSSNIIKKIIKTSD